MWLPTPVQACLGVNLLPRIALATGSTTALSTSDRFIVDSGGQQVKLRCVNWAGADKTKIPEGLQYQPVDAIATWIAETGFKCVRMIYSMDMAHDPNQKVSAAFTAAAGGTGDLAHGTGIFNTAVAKNPWLETASTLETFATVISALEVHNVMVILDNHNSPASWCCSLTDCNGSTAAGYNATNSRYFNTAHWLTGLAVMANFSLSHPNVIGLSTTNCAPATQNWYKYISLGVATVHTGNPDALIMIGGIDYFNDISFLKDKPLNRTGLNNKVVYEYHTYAWGSDAHGNAYFSNCTAFFTYIDKMSGYLLEAGQPYTRTVWMGESGWNQISTNDTQEEIYKACIIQYMSDRDMDWRLWALQGSYYFREGQPDVTRLLGCLIIIGRIGGSRDTWRRLIGCGLNHWDLE